MRMFDRDGNEIADILDWAKLIEDREYKVVGHTEVGDMLVSTVWLGIDHNWSGYGPPIIFETMVFGGRYDEEIWRYATLEQARMGHEAVVRKVTSEGDDDE